MNKNLMLEQMINHYSGGNKAKFAAMIGVTPQTLSKWISRNTYDAERLFQNCKDISASWLLSGNGEMLKEHCQNGNNHFGNSELFDICRELLANYQQRDTIMEKLITIIK